jgi:caffeic acid 3-O-methyltransferase
LCTHALNIYVEYSVELYWRTELQLFEHQVLICNSMENQMGTSSKEFDDEEENLSHYALQLASASVLPMVLKAAVELGVLEIIQRAGPGALLSSSQIASQIPTHSNADSSSLLDCMLRLLATHSILTCSTSTDHQHGGSVLRLYGLAPVSKYFIRNQDGGSMAPLLDMIQDKAITNIWYILQC